MSETANVFEDWDDDVADLPWFRGKSRALPRRGKLGASVVLLPPGGFSVYHFHHGNEEMLVVLAGRPTLRTPDGERVLEPGEAVHFPLGPDGAHGLRNDGDAPARLLMIGHHVSPDAVEYPDTRQLSVMAHTHSQLGQPLWDMRTIEPAE